MDGRKKLRIVQTADNLIYLLIVLSILSFSIETIPGLPDWAGELLRWFEIFSVGVFTIEYFIRIFTAGNRTDYIFSFYGLVDLLAILPFYVTSTIDLRAIRILRLMRLFRVFKLVRYSQAITRLKKAFSDIKEELVVYLSLTGFLIYLSAAGIYYLENAAQPENFKSIFHSLWWAIVTLTTVGYGDVYPVTLGGRIFTFVILILGLGIIAVPSGLLAAALSIANKQDGD